MAGTTPKFNLTRLLNERSREAAVKENKEEKTAEIATPEDGVSSTADIYDLIPSKGNFYSVEDVQDLKQSIELLGVLQPLLISVCSYLTLTVPHRHRAVCRHVSTT